jgi:hypothetical protein
MKRYLFMPLAVVAVLSALVPPVRAQSVALKVEPIDDIQKEYSDGALNSKTVTTPQIKKIAEKRRLQITLTNRTKEKLSGLTVKWFLFQRDLKDNEIKTLKSGTLDCSLDPSATQVLQSGEGATAYSPEQTVPVVHRRAMTTEHQPAKGKQLAGYGVQVFTEGTLLTETFVPPEFKDRVHKKKG